MGMVKDKVPLPVTDYDYYEVFAREEMDGNLFHLGCLSAPNREAAISHARLMYSEKPWVEMCIVPRGEAKLSARTLLEISDGIERKLQPSGATAGGAETEAAKRISFVTARGPTSAGCAATKVRIQGWRQGH